MASSSSGVFKDHNSPISTSDQSASNSPHVIKPSNVLSHKKRSSSVNSITSNHSIINANNSNTNTRSMSIVSLESPRNSIVSIDDNFLKSTRNNSSTSLNSLNSQNTNPINDYIISNKLNHWKNNSTAILSDEDSDIELTKYTIAPLSKFKKTSPSDSSIQLINLKKDFQFKYKDHLKSIHSTNTTSNLKSIQDLTPSPLSLHPNESDISINGDVGSKLLKKPKPNNSIQHSMYLKKKLLYSKDLQFELLNSSTNSNANEIIDTKFITSLRKSASNTNDFQNQPIITTLNQQAQLVHKLNQKWNKSITHESSSETVMKPKKRSRIYLSDDDDYDDYEN